MATRAASFIFVSIVSMQVSFSAFADGDEHNQITHRYDLELLKKIGGIQTREQFFEQTAFRMFDAQMLRFQDTSHYQNAEFVNALRAITAEFFVASGISQPRTRARWVTDFEVMIAEMSIANNGSKTLMYDLRPLSIEQIKTLYIAVNLFASLQDPEFIQARQQFVAEYLGSE